MPGNSHKATIEELKINTARLARDIGHKAVVMPDEDGVLRYGLTNRSIDEGSTALDNGTVTVVPSFEELDRVAVNLELIRQAS
jgi:hypothetical protein